MRKWSMDFTCNRCGKRFKAVFGDAIMPNDLQLMRNPLCRKCRLLSHIPQALVSRIIAVFETRS